MTNNGVFVCEHLLPFQSYLSFCSKTSNVKNSLITKINHKIKNISGDIGVMLLKLGTSNILQVRHAYFAVAMAKMLLSGLFHARLTFSLFVLIRYRLLSMSW